MNPFFRNSKINEDKTTAHPLDLINITQFIFLFFKTFFIASFCPFFVLTNQSFVNLRFRE